MKTCVVVACFGVLACQKVDDSIVLIRVEAGAGVAGVVRLRATFSNSGTSDVRLFPMAVGTTPIMFPTEFSVTLPATRTGALDIAIDGQGVGGNTIANGASSVVLRPGGKVEVMVTLQPGASLCGNGRMDPGEACDDSNRVSGDGCDYVCRREVMPDAGSADRDSGSAPSDGPLLDLPAERQDVRDVPSPNVDEGAETMRPLDGQRLVDAPMDTLSGCSGGGVCIPQAPTGWAGPVAFAEATQAAALPACSAPYPLQTYEGRQNLNCAPANCSACSCARVAGSCPATVTFWNSAGCAGAGQSLATPPSCYGLAGFGPYVKGSAAPSGSSCSASGGSPSVSPVSWSLAGRACRPSALVAGGCASTSVCVQRPQSPFEGTLCVFAAGDIPCPAEGYAASRRVFYGGHNDARTCTACACAATACSPGMAAFYPLMMCGGSARLFSVPTSACTDLGGSVASWSYSPGLPICEVTGASSPTGNCSPAMPTTVCCLP